MAKPTAIDLFSGCGGLTLGMKQAGFRVMGAIDIDSLAVETYRANHKRVVVWEEDIRRVSAAHVMQRLGLRSGGLDLLAGCPPCQGFSRMKTLNGRRCMRDKANDLVFQFLRFVRVMRPKAIMLENVPGLAKNWRIRRFSVVLRSMGYHIMRDILDAAEYGVAQRRRRFILIASQNAVVSFSRRARKVATVRQAFRRLTRRRSRTDPLHNIPENRDEKVRALIRLIPPDGGSRCDIARKHQLKCHRRCDGFKDVYGRMSWDLVAPTITSGCCNPSKGRFLHPTKHRTITLREAALLQSFPLTYKFSLRRGKFPAAEMIGNALPPEFIRRHAAQIRRLLTRAAAKSSRSRRGHARHQATAAT